MEWLLVAFLNGNAEIVAQSRTEAECRTVAAEPRPELKDATLACYKRALRFGSYRQATP